MSETEIRMTRLAFLQLQDSRRAAQASAAALRCICEATYDPALLHEASRLLEQVSTAAKGLDELCARARVPRHAA